MRVRRPRLEDYPDHPAFEQERREAMLWEKRRPYRRVALLRQFGLFALLLLVWPLPLARPIQLVVVLLHELSHAAAAYLTGGVVFGVAIDPGGAGATLGIGGNETLIVAAGYLGSVLVGAAIYALLNVTSARIVWLLLGLFFLLMPVMTWMNDFSSTFGAILSIAFLAGIFMPEPTKAAALRLLGTSSCLFPLLDLLTEYWTGEFEGFNVAGRVATSDASRLSLLTGVPQGAIVTFWLFAGLLVLWLLIDWTAEREARREYDGKIALRRSVVGLPAA